MRRLFALAVISVVLHGCGDGELEQSIGSGNAYTVLLDPDAVKAEFNANGDQLKLVFIVGPS